MLSMPRLLVMTNDAHERQFLSEVLSYRADIIFIDNLQDLAQILEKLPFDVVFCDRELMAADWRAVLDEVKRVDPSLPVIVLSRSRKQEEWLEVIQDGAFDLLSAPLVAADVFPVVEHAAASHEARFMHDPLVVVSQRAS